MEISQIRPHSTYIGDDGLVKEVRSIVMSVDGSLYVEWRPAKLRLPDAWAKRKIYEPIDQFAAWATTVTATSSVDLQHHLSGSLSHPSIS